MHWGVMYVILCTGGRQVRPRLETLQKASQKRAQEALRPVCLWDSLPAPVGLCPLLQCNSPRQRQRKDAADSGDTQLSHVPCLAEHSAEHSGRLLATPF